jgi:acyl carrier protein
MRIGVDLMSVSRFARVAEHHRYRTLVFTEAELAQAGEAGSSRCAERLAGRFCVKEATCKVLGRGFGQGLRWRDIEVTSDRWGAPGVALSGGARQLADEAGLHDIAVTLTHQVDLVLAVAAADGRRPPRYRDEEPAAPGATAADQPYGGPKDAAHVAEAAAQVFGASPDEVAAAGSFGEDIGVTSLLTIELLACLEERFAIRIPDADFYRMTDLSRTCQAVARAARW